MKFSKETTELLTNFASINMSILIREGKKLRTISPQKNVMAIANIVEDMPKEFAIYDLKQFLGTISLFEDPDLDFGDKSVKISNGSGAFASFMFAAKEAIVSASEKDIAVSNPEITFSLDNKSLSDALKAAGVLGLPEIAFVGKGGKTFLTAVDTRNDSAHTWEMPVGKSDAVYRMIFRLDNLKLLPRDYEVQISSKGISKFTSKAGDVTYYIAVETGSKYNS